MHNANLFPVQIKSIHWCETENDPIKFHLSILYQQPRKTDVHGTPLKRRAEP